MGAQSPQGRIIHHRLTPVRYPIGDKVAHVFEGLTSLFSIRIHVPLTFLYLLWSSASRHGSSQKKRQISSSICKRTEQAHHVATRMSATPTRKNGIPTPLCHHRSSPPMNPYNAGVDLFNVANIQSLAHPYSQLEQTGCSRRAFIPFSRYLQFSVSLERGSQIG